jgi:hypothetical protein
MCAERGLIDQVVACLAADYYGDHGADPGGRDAHHVNGASAAEGDAPVPPPSDGFLPLDLMRSDAVREAAIVNLRNMSSCRALMAPIARRGPLHSCSPRRPPHSHFKPSIFE